MLKTLLISANFLLLTASFSWGQTYPSLIKIGSDSLACITLPQLETVNIAFEKARAFVQMDSLYSQYLAEQKHLSDQKDAQITDLKKVISLKDSLAENKDISIGICSEQNKDKDGQIKWLKITRFICFSSAVFLAGALILN